MQRLPKARHHRQTPLGTAPAIMTKNVIFSAFPRFVKISVTIFNIQQDRQCKYNVTLKRFPLAIFAEETQ